MANNYKEKTILNEIQKQLSLNNVSSYIEQKENWGDIVVFTYKNEKLFTNSRLVIYKYSDEYSCESYDEDLNVFNKDQIKLDLDRIV